MTIQERLLELLHERGYPAQIVRNHDVSNKWMISFLVTDTNDQELGLNGFTSEHFITNHTLISELWWLE